MSKFKVRKAGAPMNGKWFLQWQTSIMRAPALWYYNTKDEAMKAMNRMQAK